MEHVKHWTSLAFAVIFYCSVFGQSASEWYEMGTQAYKAGDYSKAESCAESAIGIDRQADYFKLRADAVHKQGAFARALADYEFAEKMGCDAEDFYLNMGICRTSMGMYEDAKLDLFRYLQNDPHNAVALYYLAQGAYMQYDYKKTMQFLEEALAIDDDYMEAIYLRGATYMETGKANLAERDFQQCSKLRPDFYRNTLNVAIIKLENMETDEAVAMLEDLHSENPEEYAEILYYLAEGYYQLHDMDQACEVWKLSAELGDPYALKNHQNLCIKQNGRHKERKATFATF